MPRAAAADGLPFARSLRLGFALSVLLTACLALAAVLTVRRASRSGALVAQDAELMRKVQRMRFLDQTQVSAARGYLLTGDRRLLEKGDAAESRFRRELAELRTLLVSEKDRVLAAELAQANDSYARELAVVTAERLKKNAPTAKLVHRYETRVLPLRNAIRPLVDSLSMALAEDFEGERRAAQETARRTAIFIYAMAAGVLISAGWLARVMMQALDRLRRDEQFAARAEGELAAARVAYEELESLSYAMSHNLRAPARAINAFSSQLLAQAAPDQRPRLEAIRAASLNLAGTIDDLLRLMAIARTVPKRENVDVSALAAATAARLKRETGTQASVSVEPGLSARADRRLVETILEALLSNALKFAGRTDAAAVRVGSPAQAGREKTFFVRDNGPGFDMRHAQRLFRPFQRLHRLDEYPGKGVGLPLVARAVTAHKGRVWTESRPGEGAAFFFTLGPES